MNSRKGVKNLFWGMLSQIITIGFGIIIPRLVLVHLGSESNGLLNSVGSILRYMGLLEAGVGTATLQALYKPFAENDHNSVNRVMAATHYFYKRTGYIYLGIVVILSIGYTAVIDTTIPKLYVVLVVLIAGLSGVLSYFFQGKFKIFLAAEGKGYVVTNIVTITSVGVSITKVIVLLVSANIVLIQTVYFVFNLIQMLLMAWYMKKHYPWLDMSVKPDFDAISQKNAVLVHQVTELIFNNTDVIILSIFTTLKSVSVYSMYAMIYGMVKAVAVTLSDSFLYMLGQSYHDQKRFKRLHSVYEVYNMAFTFALFCITYLLMLPFLRLYTSGVNDINYIDAKILFLFTLFYLLANGRKSSQVIINVAQHFEKTKWRAVAEAVINLSVSIVMTIKFGVYGVLLGTVAALLYRTNDMIIYASRLIHRSALITYKRWFIDAAIFVGMVKVLSLWKWDTSSYFRLVIYGSVLSIIIIPVFVGVVSLTEHEAFSDVIRYLKRRIKKSSGTKAEK